MRFWDARSVADISRELHIDHKPLYRRLERIEESLRETLAANGVDEEDVASLLENVVDDNADALQLVRG